MMLMITYEKLWAMLKARGISQYFLTTRYGISRSRLYRMHHGCFVSTRTFNKLCAILNCQPSDIMEYYPDSSNPGRNLSRPFKAVQSLPRSKHFTQIIVNSTNEKSRITIARLFLSIDADIGRFPIVDIFSKKFSIIDIIDRVNRTIDNRPRENMQSVQC